MFTPPIGTCMVHPDQGDDISGVFNTCLTSDCKRRFQDVYVGDDYLCPPSPNKPAKGCPRTKRRRT